MKCLYNNSPNYHPPPLNKKYLAPPLETAIYASAVKNEMYSVSTKSQNSDLGKALDYCWIIENSMQTPCDAIRSEYFLIS